MWNSLILLYHLLDDLLIHRDIRLGHWDCTLHTAISDIEVHETCNFAYAGQFVSLHACRDVGLYLTFQSLFFRLTIWNLRRRLC